MGTRKQNRDSANVTEQLAMPSNSNLQQGKPAFGEITFPDFSKRAAKYMKVGKTEDLGRVRKLLMETWRLPRPKLIISVTGGAKAANLSPYLEREFRLGIVKAARNTGAWLVTGGTHTGIMQQVGKAVREHGMTSRTGERVPLIGIVPWSKVLHRDLLAKERGWSLVKKKLIGRAKTYQMPEPTSPVEYKMEECKGQACLDCNHSYFLLVDDGTTEYRGEIEFRTALEKEIATNLGKNSDEKEGETTRVPVVLLVVNGGVGTLENVARALDNGTPVVVIKGSGRAADALAYVHEEASQESFSIEAIRKEVLKRLKLPEKDKDKAEKDEKDSVEYLQQSLQHRNLIYVFELKTFRSARDIDTAILKALFKGSQATGESKAGQAEGPTQASEKAEAPREAEQLRLALIWNRADMARDINLDKIEKKKLQRFVRKALVQDRPEFVELLLEKGVGLDYFSTKGAMLDLYLEPNQSEVSALVKAILNKVQNKKEKKSKQLKFLLKSLGNLLLERVGIDYPQPPSQVKKAEPQAPSQEKAELQPTNQEEGAQLQSPSQGEVELQPTNQEEGAELQSPSQGEVELQPTSQGEEAELQSTSQGEKAEQQVKDLLLWAVFMNRPDMIEVFWRRINEKMTAALVVSAIFRALSQHDEETIYLRKHFQTLAKEWSQRAVFVLQKCYDARVARTHELLVQNSTYWGNSSCMVTALRSYNKVFIAEPACQDLRQKIWTNTWPHLDATDPSPKPSEEKKEENPGCRLFKRLSPRVIFYMQVLFYLAFLLLYGYMVLVDDWTRFTPVGCVVAFWVFAIFLDLPIQVFMDFSRLQGSPLKQWKAYRVRSWRVMDLISVVVFTVGFGLRLSGLVEPAQIVLSLGFIVFCMRLLYYFTISQRLGPKIVMIQKMVADLLVFCAIFFIFVASYAIASEALLYPNTPPSPRLLYSVPRKAFWQIFGEFFLEDIEGSSTCTSDVSTYSPGGDIRCPLSSARYVVPILLGVYIVITNVLLLNLLIAIFTRSFERVEGEAENYWLFLRTRGVYDLTLRSPLPPPLNLLYYVFWLLWLACFGCEACKFLNNPFQRVSMDKSQFLELIEWENDITDFYLGQMEYQEEKAATD